jgi:membrane fusion protein (multidrug efflux system)
MAKEPQKPTPIPADHELARTDVPKAAPAAPAAHHEEEGIPKDLAVPGGGTVAMVAGAFVVLLIAIFFVGWIPGHREQTEARDKAKEQADAKPVAQWANPEASTGESSVTLPCDVEANQATSLYTRANGFLASLEGHDIGSIVKKGQILAVISTPDVDAQVKQSEAAVSVAEANVKGATAARDAAQKTYGFNEDAQKTQPGSVSKEALVTAKSQLDQAEATLNQQEANLKSANSNVAYQKSIQDFEYVKAPFNGKITYRKYDVGQYLSAVQTGPGQEIFDVQQTDTLRAFVNVPQGYANNIDIGQTASLQVRNFPRTDFFGKVTLTAGAVDPNTRTLRVQVDFDNRDGRLKAGEYGKLRLPVSAQVPVMRIPSSALIFNGKGLTVATLTPDNKIHIKSVEVGRDFGVDLEITKGLDLSDRVVVNPGERFAEGVVIEPRQQPKETIKPQDAMPPTTEPTTGAATDSGTAGPTTMGS